MEPSCCPKCGGRLQPVVYAGVEIDRCVNCGGLWFDRQEVEQLREIKGSESLDIGDPRMGNQFDRTASKVECPRCQGQQMIRMLDIDEYSIWYEKCPCCQGIWLDAGEFKKFKDNFQPKGFFRQVREVFRRE